MAANLPQDCNSLSFVQPTESSGKTPDTSPKLPLIDPKPFWKKWKCSMKIGILLALAAAIAVPSSFAPKILHIITQNRMNEASVTLDQFRIRQLFDSSMVVDLELKADEVDVSAKLMPFRGILSNVCGMRRCNGSCGEFAEMLIPEVDLNRRRISISAVVNITNSTVFSDFMSKCVQQGDNCINVAGITTAKVGPFKSRNLVFSKSLELDEPILSPETSAIVVERLDMTKSSVESIALDARVTLTHTGKVSVDSLGVVELQLSNGREVLGELTCSNATLQLGKNTMIFSGTLPINPSERWINSFSTLIQDFLNGVSFSLLSRGLPSILSHPLLSSSLGNIQLNVSFPASPVRLDSLVDSIKTKQTELTFDSFTKLRSDFVLSFWSPFGAQFVPRIVQFIINGKLVLDDTKVVAHILGNISQKMSPVVYPDSLSEHSLVMANRISSLVEFDGVLDHEDDALLAGLVRKMFTSSELTVRVVNGSSNLILTTPIGNIHLSSLTTNLRLNLSGFNYPHGIHSMDLDFSGVDVAGNWLGILALEFSPLPMSVVLGHLSFSLTQNGEIVAIFNSTRPVSVSPIESTKIDFSGVVFTQSLAINQLLTKFINNQPSLMIIERITAGSPKLPKWVSRGLSQLSLPASTKSALKFADVDVLLVQVDLGRLDMKSLKISGVVVVTTDDPLGPNIPLDIRVTGVDMTVVFGAERNVLCKLHGDVSRTELKRRILKVPKMAIFSPEGIEFGATSEFQLKISFDDLGCTIHDKNNFGAFASQLLSDSSNQLDLGGTVLVSTSGSFGSHVVAADMNFTIPIDAPSDKMTTLRSLSSVSESEIPAELQPLIGRDFLALSADILFSLNDNFKFQMTQPLVKIKFADKLVAVATVSEFLSNQFCEFLIFVPITNDLSNLFFSLMDPNPLPLNAQISTFQQPDVDLIGPIRLPLVLESKSTYSINVAGLVDAGSFASFDIESVVLQVAKVPRLSVITRVVPKLAQKFSIGTFQATANVSVAVGNHKFDLQQFEFVKVADNFTWDTLVMEGDMPESDGFESLALGLMNKSLLGQMILEVSGLADISLETNSHNLNISQIKFSNVRDISTLSPTADLLDVSFTNFSFVDASRETGIRLRINSVVSTSLPVSLQFLDSHILVFDILLADCPSPVGEAAIGSLRSLLSSQFNLPIDVVFFPLSNQTEIYARNFLNRILTEPGFQPLRSIHFRLRPNSSISSFLARLINSALVSGSRISSNVGFDFGVVIKGIDLSKASFDVQSGDLSGYIRITLSCSNVLLGLENLTIQLAIFDDQNIKIAEFYSPGQNVTAESDLVNFPLPVGSFLKFENSIDTIGNLLGQDNRRFHIIGSFSVDNIQTAIGNFSVPNHGVDRFVPMPTNLLFPKLKPQISVVYSNISREVSRCGGVLSRGVASMEIKFNLTKIPKLAVGQVSYFIYVNSRKLGTLTGDSTNIFVISIPVPSSIEHCEALSAAALGLSGGSTAAVLDLVGVQSSDSIRNFPIAKLRKFISFDFLDFAKIEGIGLELGTNLRLSLRISFELPMAIESISFRLFLYDGQSQIGVFPLQRATVMSKNNVWELSEMEMVVARNFDWSSLKQVLVSGSMNISFDCPLGQFNLLDVPIKISQPIVFEVPKVTVTRFAFLGLSDDGLQFTSTIQLGPMDLPWPITLSILSQIRILGNLVPVAVVSINNPVVISPNQTNEIQCLGQVSPFHRNFANLLQSFFDDPNEIIFSVDFDEGLGLKNILDLFNFSVPIDYLGPPQITKIFLTVDPSSNSLTTSVVGSLPLVDLGPQFFVNIPTCRVHVSLFKDGQKIGTLRSEMSNLSLRQTNIAFRIPPTKVEDWDILPTVLVSAVRSKAESIGIVLGVTVEFMTLVTPLGEVKLSNVTLPTSQISMDVPNFGQVEVGDVVLADGVPHLTASGTAFVQSNSKIDLNLGDVAVGLVVGHHDQIVGMALLTDLQIGQNSKIGFMANLTNANWLSQCAELMLSNGTNRNLTKITFKEVPYAYWTSRLASSVEAYVDIRKMFGDEFLVNLTNQTLDLSTEDIRFSTNFKIINFPPKLFSNISLGFYPTSLVATITTSSGLHLGDVATKFDLLDGMLSSPFVDGDGFPEFVRNVIRTSGTSNVYISAITTVSGHIGPSQIDFMGKFAFEVINEISHLSSDHSQIVKFGRLEILSGSSDQLVMRDDQAQLIVPREFSWNIILGDIIFDLEYLDGRRLGTSSIVGAVISRTPPPAVAYAKISSNFDDLLSQLVNKLPATLSLQFWSYPSNKLIENSLSGWQLNITIPPDVARINPTARVTRTSLARFGVSNVFARLSMANGLNVPISVLEADLKVSPVRDRNLFSLVHTNWESSPQVFGPAITSESIEFQFEVPWNFLFRVGIASLFSRSSIAISGPLRLLIDHFPAVVQLDVELPIVI